MIIELDDVYFRGGALRSRFDVADDGLSGWFDGASPRLDTQDRPQSDGAFWSPLFRGGRSIGWHGLIHTAHPREQRTALEQLAGMCSGRGPYVMSVQHEATVTTAQVQLVKSPETSILRYGRLARYQVEVFAPDPFRYGQTHVLPAVDGAVRPFHNGTTDAVPEITVTGSRPSGYTLAYRGKQFIVAAPLASGSSHVIDMATGWVHTGSGAVLARAVSRAELFTVPKGPTGPALTITGGTGGMTVRVRDTYA